MNYLNNLKYQEISEVLWINISTSPVIDELTEEHPFFEPFLDKLNWDNQIEETKEVIDRFPLEASKYKEFSKITSISYGRVKDGKLKIKNITSEDEEKLLKTFLEDCLSFFGSNVRFIGGFNPLDFELPFIQFRCAVNWITEIPQVDLAGLKTWNIKHVICLKDIAKSTSITGITLKGLTAAFGLPLTEIWEPQENLYRDKNFEGLKQQTNDYLIATVNSFRRFLLLKPIEVELVKDQKDLPAQKLTTLKKIMKSGKLTPEVREKLKKVKLSKQEKLIANDLIQYIVGKEKIEPVW